jgi:hypothetical protein
VKRTSPDPLFRTLWLGAVIASLCNVLGIPFDIYLGRNIPGIPLAPSLVAMGVGLMIFAILMIYQKRLSQLQISLLYLTNTLAVTFGLDLRAPYFAEFAHNWVPFQANKLGCLIVALTAPSFTTGLLSIGIHVAGAVVTLSLLSESIRANLSFGEPAPTLAFAFIGILTLAYRARQMKIHRDLLRAQTEAESMKLLALSFAQVRDLMNTPLQSIILGLELLSDKTTDAGVLRKIRAALENLVQVNRILTRYENQMDWERSAEFLDLSKAKEKTPPVKNVVPDAVGD